MSADTSRAVFLSYASQDAEAARRICEALRSGGIEVWFDADGGLEHGDEWDQKIRRQIKECVLFIPVISANTQAREEGYFRIEWELAAQRALGIASGVPFILPVVIDDTREPDALVPDRFRAVQWTRLRGGEVPPEVKQRFLKLWSHRISMLKHDAPISATMAPFPTAAPAAPRLKPSVIAVGSLLAALAAVGAWLWVARPWPTAAPAGASASAAPTPAAEAQQLVAKMWSMLNRVDFGRIELEAADELGRRATTLDPNNADAWAAWSQVDSWLLYHNFANSAPRRETARTKIDHALQLAPRSFETRLAHVCYLVRGGGGDMSVLAFATQAQSELADLLRERPAEPRALLALAILQRNTDQFEAMRATLMQLAQNPRFTALAWNEIGWAEYDRSAFDAAEAAADRSIAVQPIWAALLMKMQLALWWRGDVDLAKSTFERIASTGGHEDFAASDGCWLYLTRHEPDGVLRVLAANGHPWLQSNILDGPADYFAGEAHAAAGRDSAAQIHWRSALALVEDRLKAEPRSASLLRWQARLQALTGRRDEAHRTMHLAQELAANTPDEVLGTRIAVHDLILLGDRDEALHVLEAPVAKRKLTWAQLKYHPCFEALRAEPRFQALIARAAVDPRLSPHASTANTPSASSTK